MTGCEQQLRRPSSLRAGKEEEEEEELEEEYSFAPFRVPLQSIG